jgi:hypothetical protein
VLGLLAPGSLEAQSGGGGEAPSGFVVTARAGFDLDLDGPVLGLGAEVGIPKLPLALAAAGDATFLDAITERQLALDVLYRVGGGLRLGGGPVFRNTIYEIEDDEVLGPRETRTGYSLLLSIGGAPSRERTVVTGLEVRWVRVEDFRPQTLMVRVGLSLL